MASNSGKGFTLLAALAQLPHLHHPPIQHTSILLTRRPRATHSALIYLFPLVTPCT